MAENEMPITSRRGPESVSSDASLISDLAGIILNDFSEPSGGTGDRQGSQVASVVARLVEAFSEHHRRHADLLHRALRTVAPELGGVIDELDAQHQSLRNSMEMISGELAERRPDHALGTARWLLVELLSHLGKESLSEASIVRALSEDQLRRLPESVMALLNPGEAGRGKEEGIPELVEVA